MADYKDPSQLNELLSLHVNDFVLAWDVDEANSEKLKRITYGNLKDQISSDLSNTYEPKFNKNTAFNKNFGTAVDTVTQGNDSRLSDARVPTVHDGDKHVIDYRNATNIDSGTLADARLPTTVVKNTGDQSIAGQKTFNGDYTWINRAMPILNGVPINNLGQPSIAEMALFEEQFNNKLWFYDISKFTFSYTMNGVDWLTPTINDMNKRKFVAGGGMMASGNELNIPHGAIEYRIDIRNNGTYVYLNSLYMYWSSQGNNSSVKISKKRDDGDWVTHTTSSTTVASWPGHLYLPFSTIAWSLSSGAGHYNDIRISFFPNWNHVSNRIDLYSMQIWGGYPAGKRTIYSWDEDKNVTFPAIVNAASFSGNLNADNISSGTLADARLPSTAIKVSATVINNVDWNTLTDNGIYKIQQSSGNWGTSTNHPSDAYWYGLLSVFKENTENRLIQVYYSNSNIYPIYWRMHNSGVWQSWSTLYINGGANALNIGSQVHFTSEVDNGNSGTSKTINWTNGNRQKIVLTGNCTFTFTAPSGPTNLLLKLTQDANGSRLITWPATVKWVGRQAPTLSTTAAYVDIVGLYFDGTNYYGTLSPNFG